MANCKDLLLFVTLVASAIDDPDFLAISERFWENAVVRMRGGGVYIGNGCVKGRPCVSRLVMTV